MYDDTGFSIEIEEDSYFASGVNSDRFAIWRNGHSIGVVHLAFRIIVEAMYDLLCGEPHDILSAATFFFGEPSPDLIHGESLYLFWADILGETELPPIVEKWYNKTVSPEDAVAIRELYTSVTTKYQ